MSDAASTTSTTETAVTPVPTAADKPTPEVATVWPIVGTVLALVYMIWLLLDEAQRRRARRRGTG